MEAKVVHFWCNCCRKDFALLSQKRFVNSVIEEAWTSQCPECSKTLYRLRDVMAGQDPYFRVSRYIRSQLMKHQDYLVQPGDPRFALLYPEHAKKKREEENAKERATFEDIQKKYG